MNAYTGYFMIGDHDYTPYIREKDGISWSRENTNESNAGRDEGDEMHTCVRSHQRKLSVKMLAMPLAVAQQIEQDLQAGDDGLTVFYPDIHDGMCSRLFYTTSVSGGILQFREDGIWVDKLSFNLISVKEETV